MSRWIVDELRDTRRELLDLLNSFDSEIFNEVPEKGGWTPAQIAEHLRLSTSSIARTIYAPATVTDRLPDEHIEQVRLIFENDQVKLHAPEFIVPPALCYEKDQLLNSLEELFNKIINADGVVKILKTCTSVEVSFFEGYTRFELMHFLFYHTQRHIRQLRRIQVLNRKTVG